MFHINCILDGKITSQREVDQKTAEKKMRGFVDQNCSNKSARASVTDDAGKCIACYEACEALLKR